MVITSAGSRLGGHFSLSLIVNRGEAVETIVPFIKYALNYMALGVKTKK